MTVEILHDAIGLLPNDLLLETDRKRSSPIKVIPWKRITAMAASVALILFCGLLFRSGFMNTTKSAAPEMMQEAAAPEAPAAAERMDQAAEMEESTLTGATAAPRDEAGADEAPAEKAAGEGDALCIDHAHSAAEETEARNKSGAYCGLTTATIHIGGESHTISGEDAIALTDILRSLDYSPDHLCRCAAQFTADTETQTGYEINLAKYFVRLNNTQAPLTQSQTDTIQSILDNLPLVIDE